MQADAACAEDRFLPLVDAAFDNPGGPEAKQMARSLCTRCWAATECGTWAMRHAEWGIWGGTNAKTRSALGAPSYYRSSRMRELEQSGQFPETHSREDQTD